MMNSDKAEVTRVVDSFTEQHSKTSLLRYQADQAALDLLMAWIRNNQPDGVFHISIRFIPKHS